nr:hypothetical protein [Tanacetum cinerariifolium]
MELVLEQSQKGSSHEVLVEKQVPDQVRNQVPVYVIEGLILEIQKTKEEMENMIFKAILQECGNIQAQISFQIQQAINNDIPSQVDASVRSYLSGHILHVHPAQPQTTYVPEQQYQLYLSMKDDPQTLAVCPRDQDDPHDDAHPEGEKSAKRQKTSEYETYVYGESSFGQDNEHEQGPLISSNQEQADDYDFWTDSYALNDEEIPTKQVSQDIMKEVSLNVDEAKLKKVADEILRQRCTSGDEDQYHIDQMNNFLKTPALSLINQDLLYLKKGNSGPEKIVLSIHKFLVVVFNDDMEERNSRWVNKYVKKFNPYVRYGPEKIVLSIHKFLVVVFNDDMEERNSRWVNKANDYIMSIIEPDFKNLNKNDIEDMYLLIMNEKNVNLTAPTISFPKVEKHEMFSIIYDPVHGIIYKNSKKEKRSHNNDVRYGYNQRDLTKDEVEYLKLFEEEIEDQLKYRRQMRRWESYVNGRPLGQQRERPE